MNGLPKVQIKWASAALALLALALVPATASAAPKGKPKPKVSIVGAKQADLVAGKITVKVKSKRRARVRVGVAIQQGGKKTKLTGTKSLKLKPKKAKKLKLAVRDEARPLVESCLTSKLIATAQVGGRKFTSKKTVKRDASRCNGENPVGVDLDRADRCDLIAPTGQGCLFPYPNDFYTRADATSPTGKRLDLKAAAMPQNAGGTPIDPSDINQSDGFSPGAPILVRVPGMDTPQAFANTAPPPVTDMAASFAPEAKVVVIDAATGQRQLIWTELDSNATSAAQTVLEIHPGKNFQDGHRYIVALRGMKDASGATLPAPEGFRLIRDGIPTGVPAIESRRGPLDKVLGELASAGIARDDLYLAWDFTAASTENNTGRMLAMRNDAFTQLGDSNLTDGTVQGTSPDFTITTVTDFPSNSVSGRGVEYVRTIEGTVEVPCYMTDPDGGGPAQPCDPGSELNLNANGVPQQNGTYDARFGCGIPRSAVTETAPNSGVYTVTNPARPSLYGHGLFGEFDEVYAGSVRRLGNENGVLNCAADWIGMADEDVLPVAFPALQDLSKFRPIPDRLQQGFLDFLYLGRALIHPNGLTADPAFRFSGTSAIDTNELFYWGNSQGGIAGGALTAVATDFTRSVLYVPGMTYATLLPRSVDFNDPDPAEIDYASVLYPAYPEESTRPLALTLVQSLWDRGEPSGYASHMTGDPLPGTPAHKVLILEAYGDHQVANVQTGVEARTIGAPLRRPAVDAFRIPSSYVDLFPESGTLGDLTGPAADGSGYFVWDIGPKRDNGMGGFLGTAAAADHQHAPAWRRGGSGPPRHRGQQLAAGAGPDRRLHRHERQDHQPVRAQPLLRGGLEWLPLAAADAPKGGARGRRCGRREAPLHPMPLGGRRRPRLRSPGRSCALRPLLLRALGPERAPDVLQGHRERPPAHPPAPQAGQDVLDPRPDG